MSDMVRWTYDKVDSNVSKQNKSSGCEIRQDKVQREGQMYIGLVAYCGKGEIWSTSNENMTEAVQSGRGVEK